MKTPRRFSVIRGAKPQRYHPAVQLQSLWSIEDPETGDGLDFVELKGHWCCKIVEGKTTNCEHFDANRGVCLAQARTISFALPTITLIEQVDNTIEKGTFYGFDGQPVLFFVAQNDDLWASGEENAR